MARWKVAGQISVHIYINDETEAETEEEARDLVMDLALGNLGMVDVFDYELSTTAIKSNLPDKAK